MARRINLSLIPVAVVTIFVVLVVVSLPSRSFLWWFGALAICCLIGLLIGTVSSREEEVSEKVLSQGVYTLTSTRVEGPNWYLVGKQLRFLPSQEEEELDSVVEREARRLFAEADVADQVILKILVTEDRKKGYFWVYRVVKERK